MADVYKQSFKQNYTNNIELSIFNCGIERCAPGQTWGPGIRDHYLIHLVLSGKGVFESSFEATLDPDREDVTFSGDMIKDSKLMSVSGTYTMKVRKVFSRGKKFAEAFMQGKDPRFTLITLFNFWFPSK